MTPNKDGLLEPIEDNLCTIVFKPRVQYLLGNVRSLFKLRWLLANFREVHEDIISKESLHYRADFVSHTNQHDVVSVCCICHGGTDITGNIGVNASTKTTVR